MSGFSEKYRECIKDGASSIGVAAMAVFDERERQDAKWGIQNHSWAEWATILGEEYGEFCEAVNESVLNNASKLELGGIDNMMKEAVHTAAVALEIIEKLLEVEVEK